MKITELFNTEYIAAHWLRDLTYFVDLLGNDKPSKKWGTQLSAMRAEGIPYVFDLAGARVCKDVMSYIVNFNDERFKFIDTQDPVRNGMLEENERRKTLVYATMKLPDLEDQKQIPNYLSELQKGIVYTRGKMNEGLTVRLVIIIQAYRPEITLDMDGMYEAIYSYVSHTINMRQYTGDKVSYVIGSTIFTQDRESDGSVHIPGEGNISWNNFVSRYVCVPAEFGTKCLSIDNDWRVLIEQCIREIPQFIEKRTSVTNYFK